MRLALPKGRLLPDVLSLCEEAGLSFQFASERDYNPVAIWQSAADTVLPPFDAVPEITARLRKPRVIPQLLGLGNFDAGFCGADLVMESHARDECVNLLDLGLDRVRLVAAAPLGQEDILVNPPRRPLVIATEYEALAASWALHRGLAHIIIQTYGSTEGYVPQDADIAFDCISTGRTLRANGLVVIDEFGASSTWLVARKAAMAENHPVREEIIFLKDRLSRSLPRRRGVS